MRLRRWWGAWRWGWGDWRWLRPHRRSSTRTIAVARQMLVSRRRSLQRGTPRVGGRAAAQLLSAKPGVYLLSDRARERGPKPPIEIIAERRLAGADLLRRVSLRQAAPRQVRAEHLLHMPCSGGRVRPISWWSNQKKNCMCKNLLSWVLSLTNKIRKTSR